MQPKIFLAATLALSICGATSLALAQDAAGPIAPPAPPAPNAGPAGHDMPHGPAMRFRGGPGGHGMRGGSDVIADLQELEHLYREAGRSRELPSLYSDVLAKTQDPGIRAYVYRRLAWAQSQPASFDAAIGTLRKSLGESLANEARHREEMEKMRARWEQQQPRPASPAAAK